MGAQQFTTTASGRTAAEAFSEAVRDAQYEYGHAGYTGSIAEKHGFVMITPPPGAKPEEYASHLLLHGDPRIDDKWGPAGCICTGNNEYLFFGWASS